MPASTRSPAAAASIHQWLAVAMIDSVISEGWMTISQRQCDFRTEITAIATIIAHPKCSDGIAAIWLAAPSSALAG